MTHSTSMKQVAELHVGYAFISFIPIFIFILHVIILSVLANTSFSWPEPLPDQIMLPGSREAASRLKFLSMLFLLSFSALFIVTKFVFDIKTYFSGSASYTLYLTFGLVIFVGILYLALMFAGAIPEIRERLGRDLFNLAFAAKEDVKTYWSERVFEGLLTFSFLAMICSVAALTAGAVSCLARLPGFDDMGNWKFQSVRFKTYVFLGAGFLIVSVLYFKSWVDYPAFLLTSGSTKQDYSSLVSAHVIFTGIAYSLVLAGYAIPIAYIQEGKADVTALTMMGKPGDRRTIRSNPALMADVTKMKQEKNLEFTSADIIKVVFAIMGPLITGVLADLASALS